MHSGRKFLNIGGGGGGGGGLGARFRIFWGQVGSNYSLTVN